MKKLDVPYTRLSNEILEALARVNLSPYEWRFLMVVFRKTYGHQKKEDWVALSQIVSATGMHKSHVSRSKAKLIHRKIVTQTGNNIAFNKHHRQWIELPDRATHGKVKKLPDQVIKGVPEQVIEGVPEQVPTKERFTKETFTKEKPIVLIPIFSPHNIMPDFIVMPSDDGQQEKPTKKKQPFNWNDYAELTRLMKQTCGFTTLINGTKPQDNYARHILMFLLKVLVKEHEWPEAEAIDQIRVQMEEFCQMVQRARESDRFLHSKMTSLQEIYFELKRGRIFEAAKMKNPKATSHLSL